MSPLSPLLAVLFLLSSVLSDQPAVAPSTSPQQPRLVPVWTPTVHLRPSQPPTLTATVPLRLPSALTAMAPLQLLSVSRLLQSPTRGTTTTTTPSDRVGLPLLRSLIA